jgi:hypothetical protein
MLAIWPIFLGPGFQSQLFFEYAGISAVMSAVLGRYSVNDNRTW